MSADSPTIAKTKQRGKNRGQNEGRTTDGICANMLFLSIVVTILEACAVTEFAAPSFAQELEADASGAVASSVSITLARISLSGRSRPRRRSGMS